MTGHLYRVDRKRGSQSYMKYRPPNGKQVQQRIGPVWTSKREAPPDGLTELVFEGLTREDPAAPSDTRVASPKA